MSGELNIQIICRPNTEHIGSTEQEIGKAIPLQAWTGPDGSRRLRLPNFKTIGT